MLFQIVQTAIFTVIGASLSVVLTKFLIQNGKNIIEEGKRTRDLITKIDERAEERHKDVTELLKKGFGGK